MSLSCELARTRDQKFTHLDQSIDLGAIRLIETEGGRCQFLSRADA